MSWNRRFENIGQRDWSDIAPQWAKFAPGYNTSDFTKSSLEASINGLLSEDVLGENNVSNEIFDDRSLFVSELIYTQIKANHALLSATMRIVNGNASWGVAEAYHACMMLMRSIIAAFGIFICRVNDRYVIVDAFPWSGRLDHQKKFKRLYRHDWENRAAIITCTTKQLTQSDLFALFQRVVNVSTVPTNIWPEIVVRNILSTTKTHFSSLRNMMIYGSRFWFCSDDLLNECLSAHWNQAQKRDMLRYAFVKSADPTEVDCYCDCYVLFSLSRKLHQHLYVSFSDDVGVFDNVAVRADQYGLDLLETQFSSFI